MRKILIVLFCYLFLLLAACTEQNQVTIPRGDCRKYAELIFFNYDSLKFDPVSVIDVKIEGDCLKLTLQYGGGCEEHQVDLAFIFPDCGTPPLPPPMFEIRHDAKNDACKALITKVYSFDISGIRELHKNETEFILASKNSSGETISQKFIYRY